MTTANPSVLMADMVAIIGQALDTNNVMYGPPESAPTYPMAWIRYGERSFEYGMFSVEHALITITVCIPGGGNYPAEYSVVNDMVNIAAMALLPVTVIGELVVTNMAVSEPVLSDYAGLPGAIMAATVTLETESKEINT